MEPSFAAVICAAGSSHRMGGVKKEYLPLSSPDGKPLTVLGAAVRAFASFPEIHPIVITLPADEEQERAAACLPAECGGDGRILFVRGGPTRRASVRNALLRLEPFKPSHVLIHDGARPWITRELIEKVMDAAVKYGAVIPALPLVETPKECSRAGHAHADTSARADTSVPARGTESHAPEHGFITRHLRREAVRGAQTPQAFAFPEILRAHEKAAQREHNEHREYTDDAEVWGEFSGDVAVISGDPANRKITFPEDLSVPRRPAEEESGGQTGAAPARRIGLGRDLHRLVPGRKFLLGGAEIPFDKGEEGHSDGDVLSHAICDALLGAAGLGDIGELFPPEDAAWKDADSLVLLRRAWDTAREQGWRLVNIDCTVTAEKPKILPHRERIRRSLAEALDVDPAAIFVKGKTNEGLGPLGAGEAVEALAVCLIEKDVDRSVP